LTSLLTHKKITQDKIDVYESIDENQVARIRDVASHAVDSVFIPHDDMRNRFCIGASVTNQAPSDPAELIGRSLQPGKSFTIYGRDRKAAVFGMAAHNSILARRFD
jgi:hypothetical protein